MARTHARGVTLSSLFAVAFVVIACATANETPTPSAPVETGLVTHIPDVDATIVPTAEPTTVPTLPLLETASAGCERGVPGKAGDRDITVSSGGTDRTALLHVPDGLDAAKPAALMLALHGAYDNPADFADAIGLSAVADEHGFVIAYPAAAGEAHTWGIRTADGIAADVAFISGLIDRLGTDLCLDPRRVYASGMSAGGGMTKVLACRLDGLLAGIELVSAVYGPQLGDCLPAHPVPTLAFAGLLDPLLPYYGGRIPIPLFADWPPVVGAEAFMGAWAANNGCVGEPVVGEPVGWAEAVTYQGCAAPTVLYRLGDAGHTWPGSAVEAGPFGWVNHDVSASELLWSFFSED